ncbi:MAG TPA: hypothetical protein DCY10_07045 [Clostridiales bacterium]|nr:hypothetical protein [Clostridiales bacterium]
MTEKLLPCPVCGETPEGIVDATKVIGLYRITHRCKVWPAFSLEGSTPERVAERWNTRASGWQPIETAPKDGTRVLLYRPLAEKTGDNVVEVKRTTSYDNGCWPATVPPGASGENFTDGSCYATHWMPFPDLPPAPQGED